MQLCQYGVAMHAGSSAHDLQLGVDHVVLLWLSAQTAVSDVKSTNIDVVSKSHFCTWLA
jgi:hypothetical protein